MVCEVVFFCSFVWFDAVQFVPSPCAYCAPPLPSNVGASWWTFPHSFHLRVSSRETENRSAIPPSSLWAAPRRPIFDAKQAADLPGPGAYSVNSSLLSNRGVCLGRCQNCMPQTPPKETERWSTNKQSLWNSRIRSGWTGVLAQSCPGVQFLPEPLHNPAWRKGLFRGLRQAAPVPTRVWLNRI